MAIYTTKNFGMLTAEPLDSKRVMTYNQWDSDDTAGLSYPGQIFYDSTDGWFNIYGKDIDSPNNNICYNAFAINVDGICIGTSGVSVLCTEPSIIMKPVNSGADPIIMMNSGTNESFWFSPSSEFMWFNMSTNFNILDIALSANEISSNLNEYIFGTSNAINSNTNNKVVTMIGTGLTTTDPSNNQLIIGKYNELDNYASFIVGSGFNNSNRRNAFSVDTDGIGKIDSLYKFNDGSYIRDIMGSITYSTIERIKEYVCPTISSDGISLLSNLPTDCIVDKVIIEITEAFEDGELLDVFIKDNSTNKKYIIKDYPISKIPVNSLAIENMFVHLSNCTEIHVWRHGIDYTELPGYTETDDDWICGDFNGEANIHISTAIPSVLGW